jgi:hypothetical protein
LEIAKLRKVLRAIRNGDAVSEDDARQVNKPPAIEELRSYVIESDAPLLLALANINSIEVRKLAFGLMQQIANKTDVKKFLLTFWRTATSYEERFDVVWRLLDDETLPIEEHRAAYAFAKNNKERFLKNAVEWYTRPQGPDIFLAMKQRLGDPKFPRTKHWIYLFTADASADTEAKRRLFSRYVDDPVGINAIVASELLQEPN